jgi:hypothetical protein
MGAKSMSKRHDQYMKEKLKELQPPDIIKQPEHYAQHPIQPVDFVMSNGLSFWAGNVIKYICRAGNKLYHGQDPVQSEITDIKKAIRYCEMRLNQLEGRTPSAE